MSHSQQASVMINSSVCLITAVIIIGLCKLSPLPTGVHRAECGVRLC